MKGTAPHDSPLTVSLQTGALTTWTAKYKNPNGDTASLQYVVVSASDQAGNRVTVGNADPKTEGHVVSFQVDDKKPSTDVIKDAEDRDLSDSATPEQEEGAVWISRRVRRRRARRQAGKSNDKHRAVSVDSVSLTDSDGHRHSQ